ncbi:MAG TPA: hypothetical protein VJB11_02810 [archaeon]|nr:hypothetical protein [archaeon]
MDFFAHIFWSIIVYGKFLGFAELVQTAFFSVLPDLFWGIPVFSIMIGSILMGKKIKFTREKNEHRKKFGKLYNISHSFVAMFVVFFALSILKLSFYYPVLLGWGLHLVIDMIVHKESYFEQKPLYPLSDFRVRGFFLHLNKKFVIINWSIIIILMTVLYFI